MSNASEYTPEEILRDAKGSMERALESCKALLWREEVKLNLNVDNRSAGEIATAREQMKRRLLNEYFEDELTIWVPLFLKHAPQHIRALSQLIAGTAAAAANGFAADQPGIKKSLEESCERRVSECRAAAGHC